MTLFNNVIVPLDGSESSAHALPAARLMAGAAGATLTLVRSIPEVPEWLADASRGRRRGSMAAAEHDRIDAYLLGEKLRLERHGFPSSVEIEAREGPAHEIIAGVARRDPNSLITMSTHGHGGFARFLSGSVTSKLVATVGNPTFVVRCNSSDCPVIPRSVDNVIVPLDGSAFGELPLQYAGSLASALGARITLVRPNAFDASHYAIGDWTPMYGASPFGYYNGHDLAEESNALTREYLWATADALSARFPACDIETTVSVDAPARAIVGLAERLDNPIIVMATHGRRGASRLLFGSVSDHVIRNSPAPTLLVKQATGERRQIINLRAPLIRGPAGAIVISPRFSLQGLARNGVSHRAAASRPGVMRFFYSGAVP